MLISPEYRAQNEQLHRERANYGARGDRHVALLKTLGADFLDYGCGKGALSRALPGVRNYDPCVPEYSGEPSPADVLVCTDVLEHIEPECLDAVLAHMRDLTRVTAYVVVALKPDRSKTLPDGSDPHRIVKSAQWWQKELGRYFWVDSLEQRANIEARFVLRPRWRRVTVVCWKWGSGYTAEHVNVLHRSVARNLAMDHRFVCFTDDPTGIECETLPIWPEIGQVVPPKRLNCLRRLRAFGADVHEWLGHRVLSLDLDGVVTRPLDPLIDRPEPFVIWADPLRNRRTPRVPYNGGMWLLTAGARRQVWETFDPATSHEAGHRLGYIGSDQAWISACLGDGEATWREKDGVYSFKYHLNRGLKPLPTAARVVWFHGEPKPWEVDVPWVHKHWR